MDFKRYLQTNAQKINEEVELILSEFLNQTKKTNIKLLPFARGLVNSCRGGKRIRGVLVKLGYEIGTVHLGGVMASQAQPAIIRGEKEILKIGAAYEILHTSLLIHDDIMDQSLTRRGQPAVYQALGGNHYGVSQAISLGDIGLYLAVKIITETDFPDQAELKALKFLSETIINTGWGQVMDVEAAEHTSEESRPTSEVNRGDMEFIRSFKTAKYTIAGPLQIGAILAGGEQLLSNLAKFGENAGIAFQIQDDILDGETDSLDDARSQVLEYASRAKQTIPKITKDQKMGKLLKEMTDFLVQRSK